MKLYACIANSIAFGYLATAALARAQVTPDSTTSSNVTLSGNIFEVTGGTSAGQNLFHSFTNFSVSEGDVARFINNNPTIQNVISRVTGSSASKIFGRLEAGGSASNFNLFLLNPNGIIFGPNASLNLNGSFVATTANALQFSDQGFFSASEPNDPSLLTVNPSAFLFNQVIAKPIENKSVTPLGPSPLTSSPDFSAFGLQVPDGQSLLLVGGNIRMNSGGLNAFSGRVELGGLAEPGTVGLKIDGSQMSLSFPENVVRSDVTLTNGAIVDVSGTGNGSIAVNARNIEISGNLDISKRRSTLQSGVGLGVQSGNNPPSDITLNATDALKISDRGVVLSTVGLFATGNASNISIQAGSLLLENGSGINTTSLGEGDAGDITIDVRDGINLNNSGINSVLITILESAPARGNSGKINIKARSLSLANGSGLQTSTLGIGDAGDIVVNARDFVSLDNTRLTGTTRRTQIITSVDDGGEGKGGTINIQTHKLSLKNGAQLSAGVAPGGEGIGGEILIDATDSVVISGFSEENGFSSRLITTTEAGAIGAAGDIRVDTDIFRITDGAVVSAQTLNASPGGDITINANSFEALDGGQILTTTSSNGDAGNIKLNVTDSILLSGSDPTFFQRKSEFLDVVQNEGPASGLFASSRPGSQGSAGSIIIDPQIFIIRDGAQIAVNSQGSSPAGNITLMAGNLTLDNGTISATSTSGQGGNIDLDINNLLLLRNNSSISASAGNQNKGGDGGNITINTDLLVALENSDITANAFTGRGGNIQINTRGLFLSPDSDITASSERGIDGVVEINNPEVDPSQSLTELPESVEPPQEVAQGCRPGQALGNSTFTHIGRGGLPPGPHETQTPTSVWQDLRAHNLQPTANPSQSASQKPTPTPTITEARGWVKDPQGRIYLTANVPQPSQVPQPTTTC
ncbi:filamentous hemagglutinin N-terminal domain-containing protein [Acaryochloris sp. IP29b_bin.137]|uniref:two-partner secretion domain-containing protein n=1 Tax=Acaryochloris sp. IP29b_bin.137 TaxID=2969217 RepID=UPI00262AA7D2|nr:filamentous hemagglutinin N-terminal domain-containing protein [Acaryochloris sp. IP29b_bin.137]